MFRASRTQDYFRLLVHEDIADTVRKHDVWDMVFDEETRTILISPGMHRKRIANGRYASATLSGISTSDLTAMKLQGYHHGLMFQGIDQVNGIPLFGMMDVILKIYDDESMSFTLPPTYKLPWLKPFRVACWTVEKATELVRSRLASALDEGFSMQSAVQEIDVPDMVREYLGQEQFASLIKSMQGQVKPGVLK